MKILLIGLTILTSTTSFSNEKLDYHEQCVDLIQTAADIGSIRLEDKSKLEEECNRITNEYSLSSVKTLTEHVLLGLDRRMMKKLSRIDSEEEFNCFENHTLYPRWTGGGSIDPYNIAEVCDKH